MHQIQSVLPFPFMLHDLTQGSKPLNVFPGKSAFKLVEFTSSLFYILNEFQVQ